MTKNFIYYHNGKEYQVIVTEKKMRSIRYRYRDGSFVVSTPKRTPQKTITQGLDKFFDRLITNNPHHSGLTNDSLILLGKKISLQSEGKINFTDGSQIIYEDRNDLEKKLKKWFLNYITVRHRYYESLMRTCMNRVTVRKMFSRYGSNSIKLKHITYSTILMHYDKEIIDSVIIHELAHCFEANHGDKFYRIVYKYCPNYKKLHNNLRKGNYSND